MRIAAGILFLALAASPALAQTSPFHPHPDPHGAPAPLIGAGAPLLAAGAAMVASKLFRRRRG